MSEEQDHTVEPRSRTGGDKTGGDKAGKAAARARIQQQSTWVDLQIRRAMDRGDFEDLPGYGKPIEGLGTEHDPDWWLKKLVERERIAVLPPSVQLRKEDAELDDRLDTFATVADVRRELEDFNQRVIAARYRLPEGPPLVTMPRDVEREIAAWEVRREARRRRQAEAARALAPPPRRRWWRRRRS
jgi:DnaJ-like protein